MGQVRQFTQFVGGHIARSRGKHRGIRFTIVAQVCSTVAAGHLERHVWFALIAQSHRSPSSGPYTLPMHWVSITALEGLGRHRTHADRLTRRIVVPSSRERSVSWKYGTIRCVCDLIVQPNFRHKPSFEFHT